MEQVLFLTVLPGSTGDMPKMHIIIFHIIDCILSHDTNIVHINLSAPWEIDTSK